MTDNPSTSTTGTGFDSYDAGNAIAALVTDDLTIGDNSNPRVDAGPSVDQDSQEALSADDDSTDEATLEADSSDADEQDSEADEDTADTEDTVEPTFTVRDGDKEVQVTLSELTGSYQRQANFSRKETALAEARKEFEASRSSFESEAQAVVQERGHYKVLLGQLQQAINQMIPHEPNWDELLASDPNEYLRQQRVWQTVHQQRQAAEAELQRVQSTEVAEQRQALQSYAQNSAQKLRESIPSWKDETVGRREVEELKAYARKTLGYSDEEIANAVDHRALLAVYKAMKFDALQSGAKNLKPVKAPTLAAGSSQRPSQRKRSNASKDLARSGSLDDAARVFSQMDL